MASQNLGELEKQVMEIVWRQKGCTVGKVLALLKKKIAYTTVATVLQRLYGKRFLERRIQGISYIYCPRVSKESYSKEVARSFIKKFIGSFGDMAFVSFAETVGKLPQKKRQYLLRLLKENATK